MNVAQEPLLLDINLGDDESTLSTGKNDESKSIVSEGENVGKEQDNEVNTD